ncbi:MAG: DUF2934 domain-containing protein [Verrucomicrobiota bacterium]|nr:DUF2934 domain-containing protein [Verrucomicrobiota bacterium]
MSRLYSTPRRSIPRHVSEKIGELTFHLYLKSGCPEGQEADFWHRAREMVVSGTGRRDTRAAEAFEQS